MLREKRFISWASSYYRFTSSNRKCEWINHQLKVIMNSRGRTLVKNIIPETKYETLTFKYFFPTLLSTFKSLDFSLRRDSFRAQINLELKENLKTFLEKFPKFDIKYSAFFRKKKKLIKSKRNKRKWKIIYNT